MKKFTLYVGLNDKDTKTQLVSTLEAYKVINNVLLQYVDGATIFEARGIYKHDDGTFTTENTFRIELLFVETEIGLQRDGLDPVFVHIPQVSFDIGMPHVVQSLHVIPHLPVMLFILAGKLEINDDETLSISHHAVWASALYYALLAAIQDGTLVE
jgi:hypothetical protein